MDEDVFSGAIEEADIAVHGDRIAGIGPGYRARQTVDLRGAYVAPGLIDAHVHIESSLCTPAQFTAAVLPRGVKVLFHSFCRAGIRRNCYFDPMPFSQI